MSFRNKRRQCLAVERGAILVVLSAMSCDLKHDLSPFLSRSRGSSKSFTLLELLLVIGLISVLASVTFVALNPVELLRTGRDTQRFADLDALNKSVNMAVIENTSTSLGTASTVYVSLPDASSTCGSWSLPSLPTGWAYHCAASSTYTMTNGTGWLPVNLAALSTGSPVSHDPLDPTNDATHYYQYVANPSATTWELASVMESQKYKMGGSNDKTSTDGGGNVSLYEKGTDLTLIPVDAGDQSLVGWWPLNEGSGTVAYDASGKGNNGTVSGAVWTNGKSGYGLNFPDPYCCSSKSVVIGTKSILNFNATQSFSISAWFAPGSNTAASDGSIIFGYTWGGATAPAGWFISVGNSGTRFYGRIGDGVSQVEPNVAGISVGPWYFGSMVIDRVAKTMTLYLNGSVVGGPYSISSIGDSTSIKNLKIGSNDNYNNFNGNIDDARVYNRALSTSEIQAIYNATK